MSSQTKVEKQPFTSYQTLVVVVLALLQFAVVVGFMVLLPLGFLLFGQE